MSQTANISGFTDMLFFFLYQTDIEMNETKCVRKTDTHR